MTHHKSGSLRVRKSGECLFHLFSQLEALRQSFRRWRLILDAIQGVVFDSVSVLHSGRFPPRFFLLPLTHAVNRIIRRDSIDPGPEIRSSRKLPKFLIAAQERLLDYFLGIVPVPGHAVSQPEDVVAVPLNQDAIGVAIARERALHGDSVAVGDGLGASGARLHPIH